MRPLKYRSFPPNTGRLLVPVTSRRAARASMALYPACRRKALVAQRMALVAVRLFGPRGLPGADTEWEPPMAGEVWDELLDRWRSEIGSFDAHAVHRRSLPDEFGFGLLLLDRGRPRAFVKLRPHDADLRVEREALGRVAAYAPRHFFAPRIVADGSAGRWSFLATEPLSPRIHRPPGRRVDLEAVAGEASEALNGLEPPEGGSPRWRPMHGDFTPWNLRRLDDGRLALLDWEEAGYGPPGADVVLYQATRAAIDGKPPPPTDRIEAIDFWSETVEGRDDSRRDRRLAVDIDRALAQMRDGKRE